MVQALKFDLMPPGTGTVSTITLLFTVLLNSRDHKLPTSGLKIASSNVFSNLFFCEI